MRVIIDETAIKELEAHAWWIAQDSPRSASAIVEKILHAIERLEVLPLMGHRGRARGTHERTVSDTAYVIVYEVWQNPDAVVVTGIFHGAQDR